MIQPKKTDSLASPHMCTTLATNEDTLASRRSPGALPRILVACSPLAGLPQLEENRFWTPVGKNTIYTLSLSPDHTAYSLKETHKQMRRAAVLATSPAVMQRSKLVTTRKLVSAK